MEPKRRNLWVYGLLAGVWMLVVAWQAADHVRVRQLAREELIHRARDVSSTVAITVRAFRRFGGVVSKDRLEFALKDLLQPGEWEGIVLLNEAGDTVASAGTLTALDLKGPPEIWSKHTVTLVNLVALGTNVTHDLEGTNPPVIVDFRRSSDTNHPMFGPGSHPGDAGGPPPSDRGPGPHGPRTDRDRGAGGDPEPGAMTNNPPRDHGGPPGRPRMTRPPWWSEEEWKAMLEKQGVHSFAIVMSTENYRVSIQRDLWLRSIIIFFAGISAVGAGLAWRSLSQSAQLQIRLVRASELNTHLKEMNLAAAGLAHETRNPLNIVRGLAQMISKRPDAPPEVREKSREIIEETDKVTAQLNEFINYSRPRELRQSVLVPNSVANEVVRALSYDIDENRIQVAIKGDPVSVEADEQMLRQVLFNLLLNAIQAIGRDGEIQIVTQRTAATEASLEIRDNGPGVPPERRTEIFKPYFTTQQKGTGLGLAIVQQIVLAHGWEIECLSNEPKGAIFRITHLKLVAKH